MTTRTIVTSQPDVACDVCDRRLLRGEQPDVFLAAGRRRIVCELCAPRAVHEGWMRESDQPEVSLPPMRPRRGRSFIDRLRQVARPADPALAQQDRRARRAAAATAATETPYDLFTGEGSEAPVGAEPGAEADVAADAAEGLRQPSLLELALEVFNASEYPRRVAGVARSLGPPAVTVRSAEHLASVVRIAVAWELSWYRYEVDLSEESEIVARSLGQGTELSELDREELEANAQADDSGALHLVA
jgi:hypothetical protein